MTKLTFLFSVVALVATFSQSIYATPIARSSKLSGLEGYATTNGGTTGGSGGPVVIVSDLKSFTNAVKDDKPRIVKLNGMLKFAGQVDVGSHKTIIGANSNSGLTGGGLRLKEVENVVIRNLKISFVKGTDGIRILKSTNVWVDHNEFWSDESHGKDYYDGLLDITHASDFITVSWNKFHDHFKASLIGHSDSNGAEDTGHLHVTYHHNHFYNIFSRTPSIRFGTGHFYNNLFENEDTGIHSRMGARILVEGNVWSNTSVPIETTGDSKVDGFAVQRNNNFGNSKPDITQTCSFTKAPYKFTLDSLANVRSIVTAGAGVTTSSY